MLLPTIYINYFRRFSLQMQSKEISIETLANQSEMTYP